MPSSSIVVNVFAVCNPIGFGFELDLEGSDFCEDRGVSFLGLGERFAAAGVLSFLSSFTGALVAAGDCARAIFSQYCKVAQILQPRYGINPPSVQFKVSAHPHQQISPYLSPSQPRRLCCRSPACVLFLAVGSGGQLCPSTKCRIRGVLSIAWPDCARRLVTCAGQAALGGVCRKA